MGDLLAEHVVVDVRMGVDMHQADLAMLLVDGAEDRQGDGVVAAEGQRDDAVVEDLVVGLLDDAHGFQQVEGVDRHVADVGDVQRVERGGAGGHVVRTDHHRFGADFTRAEAGAGTQGGADVERYADEGGIQLVEFLGGLDVRQAHHGGDTAETRHFVSAQGLMELLVHGEASRRSSCYRDSFSLLRPDFLQGG
ncbi:hypothetical protein D3C81_1434770 [compost metagenome]